MLKIQNKLLKEVSYDIKDEAKLASIFGIGNGYFGLRGSLEEFGDVFVQGLYIRGVFDSIVEIPLTFADNIYWSSTEYYNSFLDCNYVWCVVFGNGSSIGSESKRDPFFVRAVLAFEN